MFLTVELPVYFMFSKTDLNKYLSIVLYLPFSVSCFHRIYTSLALNLPDESDSTAFSKSLWVMVFFASWPFDLKVRKNSKADSQSENEH